ncbi:unnamed protein product, partial [Rotaria sp. Silwood1]
GLDMFGSRVSIQSASSNFMKHPAYTPQISKINGQHQYHHPPPPFAATPFALVLLLTC